MNSVTKTSRLLPGMSPQEVKKLLGDPASTQFIGELLVWRYSLHENWKGFVPHYLVFAEEPPVLKALVRRRGGVPAPAGDVDAGAAAAGPGDRARRRASWHRRAQRFVGPGRR